MSTYVFAFASSLLTVLERMSLGSKSYTRNIFNARLPPLLTVMMAILLKEIWYIQFNKLRFACQPFGFELMGVYFVLLVDETRFLRKKTINIPNKWNWFPQPIQNKHPLIQTKIADISLKHVILRLSCKSNLNMSYPFEQNCHHDCKQWLSSCMENVVGI